MPPASESQPAVDATSLGPTVEIGSFRLTAPEGWVRKQPRSSFTLAEFSLPRAEGDTDDARLTVTIAGGTLEANVDRWRGQVGGKDDSTPEKLDIAGVQVTLVNFSGNFADQHGAMMTAEQPQQPEQQQQGSRLIGAIIPLGDQLGFVKCTGPDKTVAQHADELRAFVKSMTSAVAK